MIYIHVPFCHRKCIYCAFFSKVESGKWKTADYIDALIEEMRQRRDEQTHPIRTVYLGGGTPSMLSFNEIKRVVESMHRCFDLSQVEEMTLEANPEDLTRDYLDGLLSLGFNRLSIGIQSLDDEVLRMLNRRHTVAQALEALSVARQAGFRNISVDFIYGIRENLDVLDNLDCLEGVTHVSAYALSVEPGTALAAMVGRGRIVLPGEDEVVRQYHVLHRQLEAAGLQQYEVSNYARPGFESKHNSRYWDRTPYLGLGPGAHSFDGFRRRWNNPDGTIGEETLSEADAYNEMLMTALRTTRGLSVERVPERYRKKLHQKMQPYVDCGWVVRDGEWYRPTEEGLLHADGMAAELFLV